MKRAFFILFLFAAIAQNAGAQPCQRGAIKVRLSDNYPITLAVDGRYYKKYGPTLTVGDLPHGRHDLKIYTYNNGGKNSPKAHLVYRGSVKVFRGEVISMVYDERSGEMDIQNRQMAADECTGARPYRNDEIRDDVYAAKAVPKKEIEHAIVSKDAGVPYPAIKKDALKKLGTKVKGIVTDTDKLKEMKTALDSVALNTQQVAQVLPWLNFEASKLDFAKWAYSRTTDRVKYAELEKQFSNEENKSELRGYIK